MIFDLHYAIICACTLAIDKRVRACTGNRPAHYIIYNYTDTL